MEAGERGEGGRPSIALPVNIGTSTGKCEKNGEAEEEAAAARMDWI
jgi:hypothetical protein